MHTITSIVNDEINAWVAELVDARDLKSLALIVRAGSIPALGTMFMGQLNGCPFFVPNQMFKKTTAEPTSIGLTIATMHTVNKPAFLA